MTPLKKAVAELCPIASGRVLSVIVWLVIVPVTSVPSMYSFRLPPSLVAAT